MRKKNVFIIISCMVVAMGMTACGKNPESSIVKNKDFDKLIEEAQKDEGKDKSVKDIAPDYDTYKNSFQDEKLGVSVQVDATVDIPAGDKMSVLRVKQKDISQKFIDTFIENYAKDVKLYDGSVTQIRTKKEIEKEISVLKDVMKTDSGDMSEEYKFQMEELQSEYENAPADVKWDDYVSDKQLCKVEDIYKKRNNSFYEWVNDLNPKGEILYAINDGKEGEYISVYAQNSDNYSNCFRYRKSKHGYEFIAKQAVTATPIQQIGYEGEDFVSLWKGGDSIPKNAEERKLVEYKDEKATLSEEEAKKQAEELMQKMDLKDFAFYDCGLYCEIPDIRKGDDDSEQTGYHNVYIIRYMRKIDDVFVTSAGAEKFQDEHGSGGYVKRVWPQECVEIRVNDNGIVGFDYNSPIEIVDTVVDKSNMKNFDEVKKTFEKMSIITNANDNTEGGSLYTSINIEKVVLGYVMISEENNFDTGLLVPGWDFIGVTTPGYKDVNDSNNQFVPLKRKKYGSILTINAIDGTVIDRRLGY